MTWEPSAVSGDFLNSPPKTVGTKNSEKFPVVGTGFLRIFPMLRGFYRWENLGGKGKIPNFLWGGTQPPAANFH